MPFHPEEYTCAGHKAADRALPERLTLPPTFNMELVDVDRDGILSNMEFYLALEPNNPDLNDYVLDNFLWAHCEEAGALFRFYMLSKLLQTTNVISTGIADLLVLLLRH
jgi:hypothetical protein